MTSWVGVGFFFGIGVCYIASVLTGELELSPKGDLEKPEGNSLVVTCTRSADSNTLENVQWQAPDGSTISEDPTKTIHAEEGWIQKCSGCRTLVMNSVTTDDNGQYTCIGVVDGEPKRQSFVLQVYKDLEITNAPRKQSFNEYEDAIVKCEATADPPPKVEWKETLSQLKNNEDRRIRPTPEGLLIEHITMEDEGTYVCRVRTTGPRLSLKRIPIEVVVNYEPKFTSKTKSQYGWIGGEIELYCQADARPPATYTWYKGGVPLKQLESETDERFETITDDKDFSSILKFTVDNESDFTTYQCQADNGVNSLPVEQQIKLNEAFAPDPPQGVQAKKITPSTVTLKVEPPISHGGLELTAYRVQYKKHNENIWNAEQEFPIGEKKVIKVRNLTPNTEYEFRVFAVNKVGPSFNPHEVMIKTVDGPVVEPSSNANSIAMCISTTLLVTLSTLLRL